MAFEKSWEAIPAKAFISDGGTEGQIQLSSTAGFKAKQQVVVQANAQIDLFLEIKEVSSATLLLVGPRGSLNTATDLTGYTVLASAQISAPKQPRNGIPEKEIFRACLAEEPISAWRNALVDQLGNYYSASNPFPVFLPEGTVSENPIFAESPNTITSSAEKDIFSYTSLTDSTKIEIIHCVVSTPSLISLKVDGILKRQFWTSPLERNAVFEYKEPLPLVKDAVLTITAIVDRFILTEYETFTSLEGFSD